jgi:hypothetical protein
MWAAVAVMLLGLALVGGSGAVMVRGWRQAQADLRTEQSLVAYIGGEHDRLKIVAETQYKLLRAARTALEQTAKPLPPAPPLAP